jgi:hypothetical protein
MDTPDTPGTPTLCPQTPARRTAIDQSAVTQNIFAVKTPAKRPSGTLYPGEPSTCADTDANLEAPPCSALYETFVEPSLLDWINYGDSDSAPCTPPRKMFSRKSSLALSDTLSPASLSPVFSRITSSSSTNGGPPPPPKRLSLIRLTSSESVPASPYFEVPSRRTTDDSIITDLTEQDEGEGEDAFIALPTELLLAMQTSELSALTPASAYSQSQAITPSEGATSQSNSRRSSRQLRIPASAKTTAL